MLKSGWHFPIPIAFLIATLAWPEFFQIPIERAAIYSTAMLIVLSLAFGYRGSRVTSRQMLRAILDTGRAALDIVLIGAAAGMVVGALNVSGISFGLTLQLIAISGENLFVLLLLTAIDQHHPRHGHADGQRLCADRLAAWRPRSSSSASRRWPRTCT